MVTASQMVFGGVEIGDREVKIMADMTVTVMEVLEKAWLTVGCTLVDMKVEFGVNTNGMNFFQCRFLRIL